MKAIRGAVTVKEDTPECIKKSVKQLLDKIKEKNELLFKNIVYIMFSNTDDIHSFYPVKAAREAGYFDAPLFSSLEPNIDGSLKKCIRVLILCDAEIMPEHVYLGETAMLRKDLSNVINIALDGPAGSGKSTISDIIAKKLNILCLDTGAMYRACALACLNENVNADNERAVEKLIKKVDISVEHFDGKQKTLLNGADVSDRLRTPEISMLASKISALKCVRDKMINLQRKIAESVSCILDGRDIGTNVLPNAPFKFFLTASPEVRARRRTEDNLKNGYDVPYEQVFKDVILRDKQDATRKIAPLKQASDAVLVDSSEMTVEEVVDFIIAKIQEKI